MRLQKLGPAVAIVAVFGVACGSSPTAPTETTSPVAVEPAGVAGASSVDAAARSAPRGACGIEAIGLRALPSVYRRAQSVAASFKGDTTYCAPPTWSTFPATRVLQNGRSANLVTVFDDPANKRGIVHVTASVVVETSRLSQTIQITFPRGGTN